MDLEGFLARQGLIAVFLGCFFEGETAALLGGVISHRGLTGWAGTATMAFLGAFLADQLWFLLSRHMPQSGRIGRYLQRQIRRAEATRLHQTLAQHPVRVALMFRYIPGTRILGPIMLGRSTLPWRSYLLLNGATCLIWAALFTAIGFHFGQSAEALFGRLHRHHFGLLLLGLLLAGAAIHCWLRHRRAADGV